MAPSLNPTRNPPQTHSHNNPPPTTTHRQSQILKQTHEQQTHNNPPPTTDPQANQTHSPRFAPRSQTHRSSSPPPPPSADPVERNTQRRDRPNPGPRVGSRSGPCTKQPRGDLPRFIGVAGVARMARGG
uniref:Uncharacterized protein n=1 Tax=Fagus sylvatica TaxID=28930 RepID=A0A2N9IR34_FAGSY